LFTIRFPTLSGDGQIRDQSLTVAQYTLHKTLISVRLDRVVRPVKMRPVALVVFPVEISHLAEPFGGVGGGFSVSSGEPAHTTLGPITLT
jgi:hypothetical protein